MNRTPWIPEIFERRIAMVHFVIGIFRSIFRARRVTRNYSSTIIWDADSRNERKSSLAKIFGRDLFIELRTI